MFICSMVQMFFCDRACRIFFIVALMACRHPEGSEYKSATTFQRSTTGTKVILSQWYAPANFPCGIMSPSHRPQRSYMQQSKPSLSDKIQVLQLWFVDVVFSTRNIWKDSYAYPGKKEVLVLNYFPFLSTVEWLCMNLIWIFKLVNSFLFPSPG